MILLIKRERKRPWRYDPLVQCLRAARRPSILPAPSGRTRLSRRRRRETCAPAWCISSRARARPGTLIRPGKRSTSSPGVGRVQSAGGPVREVRAGDVVWFPPNEKHWHGAGPQTTMAHIAMTEVSGGKYVEWMEKVTDQQYQAALGWLAGAACGAACPPGRFPLEPRQNAAGHGTLASYSSK